MRRASAPATLSRTTKPPPPPPPAAWALRRASKSITKHTEDLAQALVVREVLAECVEDVAQAHHENEVNELRDLVDDQSLRLEVIEGERDAARLRLAGVPAGAPGEWRRHYTEEEGRPRRVGSCQRGEGELLGPLDPVVDHANDQARVRAGTRRIRP